MPRSRPYPALLAAHRATRPSRPARAATPPIPDLPVAGWGLPLTNTATSQIPPKAAPEDRGFGQTRHPSGAPAPSTPATPTSLAPPPLLRASTTPILPLPLLDIATASLLTIWTASMPGSQWNATPGPATPPLLLPLTPRQQQDRQRFPPIGIFPSPAPPARQSTSMKSTTFRSVPPSPSPSPPWTMSASCMTAAPTPAPRNPLF